VQRCIARICNCGGQAKKPISFCMYTAGLLSRPGPSRGCLGVSVRPAAPICWHCLSSMWTPAWLGCGLRAASTCPPLTLPWSPAWPLCCKSVPCCCSLMSSPFCLHVFQQSLLCLCCLRCCYLLLPCVCQDIADCACTANSSTTTINSLGAAALATLSLSSSTPSLLSLCKVHFKCMCDLLSHHCSDVCPDMVCSPC